MPNKKVFVSGCYDLLHSGHVEFFQQASRFGDLYVGIGSDATYMEYKHRKPMFPQEERLFMVQNVKAVKEAGNVWAVPVIDLNALSGLFPLYDAGAQLFNKPDTDRLHPNDPGHERMAKTILYQLASLPCVF